MEELIVGVAQFYRLRNQFLRLEGEECLSEGCRDGEGKGGCKMFPPHDVCRRCGGTDPQRVYRLDGDKPTLREVRFPVLARVGGRERGG